VEHDLPGVGENLQDHLSARVIYRCTNRNTLNDVYHSWWRQIHAGAHYVFLKRGPLMTGAAPIGLFFRTRPELDSPDVQFQFLAGSAPKSGEPMHPFPGCTVICVPCRPESRGWVRVVSPDPARPPAIQPNYFSTQADRDTMAAGLRVARRVFQTAAMRRYVQEEFLPGPGTETAAQWQDHVRATGGTTFHPAGTCMMGPGPMAVVDTELRVKGMAGLRVIDASIMPTVVSGNTNAACIMIGEKGADAILRERRNGVGTAREG
jgi:choline dehydrogenase